MVLGRYRYSHPVFTVEGTHAQRRWAEISGMRKRTWYCGAYWANGFHEDGVVSAVRVAARAGSEVVIGSGIYVGTGSGIVACSRARMRSSTASACCCSMSRKWRPCCAAAGCGPPPARARLVPARGFHWAMPTARLPTCVRERVQQETGSRPTGPVMLLANLRYFGVLMNPIAAITASTATAKRCGPWWRKSPTRPGTSATLTCCR